MGVCTASFSEGSLRTLSAVVSLMGSLTGSLISIEDTEDVTTRRLVSVGIGLSDTTGGWVGIGSSGRGSEAMLDASPTFSSS